jgi:hypothetical protein
MATLSGELALAVRWSNQSADRRILAASGTAIPFEMETVVGSQEVSAGRLYEIELLAAGSRVLHVSGAVPPAVSLAPEKTTFAADAWVRFRLTQEAELQYEIHLGPAGMDQPKACHRGRIALGAGA